MKTENASDNRRRRETAPIVLPKSNRGPKSAATSLRRGICGGDPDANRRVEPVAQRGPLGWPGGPTLPGRFTGRWDGPRQGLGLALLVTAWLLGSCTQNPAGAGTETVDLHLATNGTVEVTARLLEIPEGAIFKRDLYDYATVLKYRVLKVHRGEVKGDTIFVGHYDPWKPRREAADRRVKGIGGDLDRFEAGQVQRMALEAPIEDHFMGGMVNKYFGRDTGPIYWALWTNRAHE
jgi:hypothetical protein